MSGKGDKNRTSNYKQFRENFDRWKKNEAKRKNEMASVVGVVSDKVKR